MGNDSQEVLFKLVFANIIAYKMHTFSFSAKKHIYLLKIKFANLVYFIFHISHHKIEKKVLEKKD